MTETCQGYDWGTSGMPSFGNHKRHAGSLFWNKSHIIIVKIDLPLTQQYFGSVLYGVLKMLYTYFTFDPHKNPER